MKRLFSNNKSRQTFAEDSQYSPVLDPKLPPKSSRISRLKIDKFFQEKTQIPLPLNNTKYNEDIQEQQVAITIKDEVLESQLTQKSNSQDQLHNISTTSQGSKTPQFSPQKMLQMAINIFNKQLMQIKSINQDLLTPQLFFKLRERITKHINDCISLVKVQLKYQQRTINSQSIKTTQQPASKVSPETNDQQAISLNKENSTSQVQVGSHLDLIQLCIDGIEQLNKYQINYQETISLMEKLFKTFEGYSFITNLPYVQNIQLEYIAILLRCGFLVKAERSFTQMQQYIEQYKSQQNEIQKQETSSQINKECTYEAKRSSLQEESCKDSFKINQKFDLSRYYCLYCQFLKDQGEVDTCFQQSVNIQNSLKVEVFILKISMFIECSQLEQALYLIDQGRTIFQRHKQPLVFLQLMNLKLKILLIKKQYSTIHNLLQEIKEFFEQSKLKVSIEFCQSLIYESQAFLAIGCTTESLNLLEEANTIAREILKDRYNQSSITADIYYFKALCWLQKSQNIENEEEKFATLKNAQQICQLCIKIRKNYLYSKQEKNQKVIDSLQLNVNLLAVTNQNRECRKASAELIEYELI